QGDARFGDIRISAAPLSPGVVAIGTPYDPSTGTLSGDIIINSNADFNPSDPGSYDLYTVVLHEAGHVFGFADSPDPSSFMYNVYEGPVTGLAPGTIPALQALYGAPVPGASEIGPGNPTNGNPGQLQNTNSNQPGVASAAATLSSDQDTDVFKFQPQGGVSYAAGLDVRVQTQGISLLAPTLTVTDASGRVLATSSAGPLAGGVSVHLGGIASNATYYVKVSGSADVFGVGAFQLTASATNAGTPVVGGQHVAATALSANSLLGSLLGSLAASGTISPSSTSAFYSFTTPLLTLLGGSVSLQTWGVGIGQPRVTVYDASMHVVAQAVPSETSDDLSLHIASVKPLSKYFIEVDAAPTTSFGIGDYVLQVGFLGPLALVGNLLDDVVAGVVAPTPAQSSSLSRPIALAPSPIAGNRVVSSLTPSIPLAVYQVQPPSSHGGATQQVMTVSVVTLDSEGITPVVNVYDSQGNPVAAQVLAAEGGAYVVQVACSSAVSSYLIQVKGGALGMTTWTGAYYLDATFGAAAANPAAIASGRPTGSGLSASLSAGTEELFRFVATAGAGDTGAGERVTIKDSSGHVVASMAVYSGQSESLTVLLGPGSYTVTVAAIVPFLDFNPPPSLLLVGMDFSDPIKAYSTNSGATSPPPLPS
ncbi:MAG TPA: matrixin family metalloprotease, partial [Isosphaeraceae bacterium]